MNKKDKLIERMGVHLEHKEQLAPLAARILASLILKGKKGETFENLVCELKASKSTIFTHLTNLQASHRITYYTKTGDRKKYFILSPNAWVQSMDEMISSWNEERDIHLEIIDYKSDMNKSFPEDSEEKFDLNFHYEYLNYLNQASSMMINLRTKLIENHKND
ncbi:GbsR/MarR family transcriptional regulator [Aequorivita sinensis]|uniref:GbsR/MarR family transcriptional regulator n=1 Tax=Aequorivita sinensis TaxID=1382458 RepID=UPI001FE5D3B6|nr:transcriptional regulator [Aequorivita sinensis]